MNSLKITVITATYNSGATIADTLNSVVSQTYSNIEHIIVDGKSSDNTIDIVRSFADKYRSRGMELKWISEKDNGIYDAMNKGINLADGEVIGLLNSDDFYSASNILSKVAEVFSKAKKEGNKLDAVYGDIHYVKSDNLHKCVRYYSSAGFKRWKMRLGFMPAHPSFYCRRETYRQHGLYDTDFRIAADFEQLLRLIFIHGITTSYIKADFVTMRTGGASSSGFSSHRRIYSEHRKAYRKNGVYSNFFLEGLRYISKIIEICKANIN